MCTTIQAIRFFDVCLFIHTSKHVGTVGIVKIYLCYATGKIKLNKNTCGLPRYQSRIMKLPKSRLPYNPKI